MRKLNALGRLKSRLSANGPGLTVAVIAMLIALTGGAFAASGALTSKQVKQVKALIKKEAKPGPKGDTGAQGAKGDTGAQGPKGDTGAQGPKGDKGDPGASVKVTPVSAGDPEFCGELGGALVEKENSPPPAEVCNGEKGPKGDPGSPWTAGGTLPAEGMLTGSWMANGSGVVDVPLSFAIHLAGNLKNENIYYGTGEESEIEVSPGVTELTPFGQHCLTSQPKSPTPGGVLNPSVSPGHPRTLCIYVSGATSTETTFVEVTKAGNENGKGGGRAGAFLRINITTPGSVYGTYAISGG